MGWPPFSEAALRTEREREREREGREKEMGNRKREKGEGKREGGRERLQTLIHSPPQQRRLLRRNLMFGHAEYKDGLLGTKRRGRGLPYMTSSA